MTPSAATEILITPLYTLPQKAGKEQILLQVLVHDYINLFSSQF